MAEDGERPTDPRVGGSIAQFRVVERIGEGAMGVVYRAEDTRLGRIVALKVLRPWVDDRAALELLLREARSAAAVAHPGIAAVYEVGEARGETFIAMEHVVGETLRGRLGGGALPPGEVLRIGLDVGKALARAHAAGVVHRDLKPENLMLTDDGVKILDFGLAKLRGAPPSGARAAADVAPADALRSVDGQVVGTPGYMSPEQGRGEPVDGRSDLFSLGAVLYELATGSRPFEGPTALALIVATSEREPVPPSRLDPRVTADLERIVLRCLAKRPADRYASADELVTDLRRALERIGTLSSAPTLKVDRPAHPSRASATRFAVMGLAFAIVATAPLVFWKLARAPAPAPPARQATVTPFGPARRVTANPADDLLRDASISADGRTLAYLDESGLHLRDLETGRSRSVGLPPPPIAREVVWAPGGRTLVLEMEGPAGTSIWRVDIASGAHRLLRDGGSRPAVSPTGRIAFMARDALWSMDADGRHARLLVRERSPEVFLRAAFSPDGSRIAYVAGHPYGTPDDLVTVPVNGGAPVVVLSDRRLTMLTAGSGAGLVWGPDGRILFVLDELAPSLSGSTLAAVPVDERSGRRLAAPTRLAHWAGVAAARLSMSADGRRLAVLQSEVQSDVWVAGLPADRSRLIDARRLTRDDRNDVPSAWTPDGRSVLFTSDRAGAYGLWRQPMMDGPAVAIPSGPGWNTWPIPSPDGRSLLFWSLAVPGPDPAARRIAKIPSSGGVPRIVGEAGVEGLPRPTMPPPNRAGMRCALRAKVCAVGTVADGALVVRALDPDRGPGEEIARVPIERDAATWDLSPDGSRLVVRSRATRVVTFADGSARTLDAPPGCDHPTFDPAGDGVLFACNDARHATITLLSGGTARELWQSEEVAVQGLVPSADGSRLAFTVTPLDNDAWLLERGGGP